MGIGVKVKIPKEIRDAAKTFPEFEKEIGDAMKTMPGFQKQIGPMTKEVGRFNTTMEKMGKYLPWILGGGAVLVIVLVAMRKGNSK